MECSLGTTTTNLIMYGTWLPSLILGYTVFHLLNERNSRKRSPFENHNTYRLGSAGAVLAGMAIGMVTWWLLLILARSHWCAQLGL